MSPNISGFDKLQRDLTDAQRAFQSLDGTIATLKFDPKDRTSVAAAVRQMEAAVDAKTRSYRGNALVEQAAKALKQRYRSAILDRAAKGQKESGGGARSI